jgi:hypothetical protein
VSKGRTTEHLRLAEALERRIRWRQWGPYLSERAWGTFREEGETGHPQGHLDYLRRVGDPVTGKPTGTTVSNLEAAIAGETFEHTTQYPAMAVTAREEGFHEIADWFETRQGRAQSRGPFSKGDSTLSAEDPW